MRLHTSFKIGCPADMLVCPLNTRELSAVLKKCGELSVPFFIIGNGSNLLVSDGGIEGAVISLAGLNRITVCGEELKCGAGAMLSAVCKKALDEELTGLEFAYGIPGTVGGAQVSEKHAGFVINLGYATCKDVQALVKKVQEEVYKGDGVKLEPEIIIVGRSED